MLRVCHIASGDLWAGAEVVIEHLVEGLALYRDLELSLVLLNEGKLADRVREVGIPVLVLDEKSHSFSTLAFELSKVFQASPPDIVHSHRYKENILAFLMSLRFPRMKLVSTQHGMQETQPEGTSLKHRIVDWINCICLFRGFARLVVVSEEMRQRMLLEQNYAERKVNTIHNGVQVPKSQSKPSRRETFLIGSCGRLFPVKDYPFLVEVAQKVLAENSKVEFVLAGEGPEAAVIRKLVVDCGLANRFILLGNVDDMSAFYRSLDLFINTSFHEGIPMSILEAMSHGVPVVAPAVGGIPEIIDDGLDGFLVRHRDANAFRGMCIRLARDYDLRLTISTAAKRKIEEKFSLETMASRYHRLYNEIAIPGNE